MSSPHPILSSTTFVFVNVDIWNNLEIQFWHLAIHFVIVQHTVDLICQNLLEQMNCKQLMESKCWISLSVNISNHIKIAFTAELLREQTWTRSILILPLFFFYNLFCLLAARLYRLKCLTNTWTFWVDPDKPHLSLLWRSELKFKYLTGPGSNMGLLTLLAPK